jgi:hypothetical protein
MAESGFTSSIFRNPTRATWLKFSRDILKQFHWQKFFTLSSKRTRVWWFRPFQSPICSHIFLYGVGSILRTKY